MKPWWLGLAYLASVAGWCGLALAMQDHWRQVVGRAAAPAAAWRLRLAGLAAGGLGGWACWQADQGGMAALVWVMVLSASAFSVSLLLTWRPAWLRPLGVHLGGVAEP